ncbi:MAG: DUF349 domain-containing protein [Paludibacteraceae bacterium]|nr:DUF349 domain-containing protein [Paludibacteraceae bacterium]
MANTRQEIIDELKALLEQDVVAIKEQVDHLKTRFYSNEEGSEVAQEQDPIEEEFKQLLAQYKAKRAEVAATQAKEQADNLARKQAILDEMKSMVEGANADGVMANLQRMRELQATWKTIGPVPATHTQEIRKAYQQCQEQFYDLVKINIELRDLDFKKNLELKLLLCEAAEKLQENNNIVEASRALQKLHDEWAEIGPVAREVREDLWNRFKTASTIINKKHQAYFDELHAKEQENLAAKQAIIDQLKVINEPIVNGEPWTAKVWEEMTQKVQELQTAWRKIGFAPKKFNQSIYDAYRAESDRFFAAKKEFFLELRERRKEREQRHKEYLERQKAREERQREREDRMKAVAAKGGDSLRRMRERLQQEIKTAENNILFFSAKSKTANKLVGEMQAKIDALKVQLKQIEEKINELDD